MRIGTCWVSPARYDWVQFLWQTELIYQRQGCNPATIKIREYNSHLLIKKSRFLRKWELPGLQSIFPEVKKPNSLLLPLPFHGGFLGKVLLVVKSHCQPSILVLLDLAMPLTQLNIPPSSWASLLPWLTWHQCQRCPYSFLLRPSVTSTAPPERLLSQVASSEGTRSGSLTQQLVIYIEWCQKLLLLIMKSIFWKIFWYQVTTTAEQNTTNFLRTQLSSQERKKKNPQELKLKQEPETRLQKLRLETLEPILVSGPTGLSSKAAGGTGNKALTVRNIGR